MVVRGETRTPERLLTCRVGEKLCGLLLTDVLETLRALPLEQLPGLPRSVRGLALIRGRATPVVDLRTLLGSDDTRLPGRYVTLRSELAQPERALALAVDEVLDVVTLTPEWMGEVPAILTTAQGELVRQLGALDRRLMLVLERSRLLPEPVWQQLARNGAVG